MILYNMIVSGTALLPHQYSQNQLYSVYLTWKFTSPFPIRQILSKCCSNKPLLLLSWQPRKLNPQELILPISQVY